MIQPSSSHGLAECRLSDHSRKTSFVGWPASYSRSLIQIRPRSGWIFLRNDAAAIR